MELRDLLTDTDFLQRRLHARPTGHEAAALRRLARVLAGNMDQVLQELVEIALEFCDAESAGISLEEKDEEGNLRFRWVAIAGSFAKYLHGTTPRFFSPCGTCLDAGRPQLYRVTQPYYDFLGVQAEPITDGMLIPWSCDEVRGTLWAVGHSSREIFDLDDYKLLSSLADFASIAIRHQSQEKTLRKKESDAAIAAIANRLAHEINNPLQSLTNTLFLAQEGGPEMQSYVEQASRELSVLSVLVKDLLTVTRSADRETC